MPNAAQGRKADESRRNNEYRHLDASSCSPDRRDDLQGVRGWAVFAVLVFHFVPSLFPYGFLGVDAFFVLSGFLITLVLSRDDPLSPSSYLSFYARRVKRIFPLYLLVVTFCLLLVVLLYDNPELLFYNTRSALRALIFTTNLKGENREEEYFRQVVSSHDLFTHTWSLAVEVQFYLIAPILLLPGKVTALRVLITLLTGFLIVHDRGIFFLLNRFVVYLGDISYALYLVHWPVYTIMMHYDALGDFEILPAMVSCAILAALVHELFEVHYLRMDLRNVFIIILTMYMTSTAVLHTVQGTILTFDTSDVQEHNDTMQLPVLVPANTSSLWDTNNYMNVSHFAVRINAQYENKWYENLKYPDCKFIEGPGEPFGLTECEEGQGKYNFLVMGNSYTANLGRLVQKHFKKHYKKFTLFAVDSCEALIDISMFTPCTHSVYLDTLKKVKPDVLFIIQRFLNPAKSLEDLNITKDSIYQEIKRDVDTYAPLVKKMFILNALPRPKPIFWRRANKYAENPNMSDVEVNEGGTSEDAWPMRARMAEIAKNCSNCFIYDFYRRHLLSDNSTFMVVDPRSKILIFERTLHYTPYGLRLIEPVYETLSEQFEQFLNAKYPNNILE